MNRREIRSTRSPTTTSIRRHSSGYGQNRQKHLAEQRQQRLEEQRARIDTCLLPVPAASDAANSEEEDRGLKKKVALVAPPSRNTDLQKKMNVAALSEAMSGSPRKQHNSSSLVQVLHHQIGHLPRYGSKSLSAVGRSQQHKNKTVKEAPRHPSHSSQKAQLNSASSDSTAHTVQISDDEISSDASSNRSTSMEADTDDILGVVTSTKVEDVIASKDTEDKKVATMEHSMAQQQLTKAKAEIQAKQEVINQLTKDLDDNMSTKDASILKLEMQNKALIDEKEDLAAKIKLQESEFTELTASHRTLQFEYNKDTSETNNIKTVTDLEEKVARLTNEIDNKSSENSSLHGDVRRLERELQECKEELNGKLVSVGDEGAVREKQSLLEKSICEKDKKIQHLGCDLSAAQFESRKLQSKIDAMAIASEATLAELTALKEWKVTSEQLLNEKDITAEETKAIQRESLQQKDAIISSLHDQLNEKKEELKDIKKSVNDKDEMISRLEDMVSSLRDQLKENKDELEDCKKSKIEQEIQLNLQMETQLKEAMLEQESIQKHLTSLQEANSIAEVSLLEKSVIISTLSSNTKRLEAELEDCKEFYAKKMLDIEKQTTTLKPTRQMESELRTKEVEIELLKIELKR
jgi:chromosome segregation ATPase